MRIEISSSSIKDSDRWFKHDCDLKNITHIGIWQIKSKTIYEDFDLEQPHVPTNHLKMC